MTLRRFRTIAPVLAGLALVSACGPGTDGPPGEAESREQRIPAVEAVEVRYGSLPLEERLAGSARARNQTEIYAAVSAPIVAVLANDGDFVEAGTPLVRLRDTDFDERVKQAEAGLAVAEARVRQAEASFARLDSARTRMQAMGARNLASAADLEAAEADALSAAADLSLMQAQRDQAVSLVNERRAELNETVIRAPVTGVVGGRNAEVGQLANTGSALFVIGDPSDMLVNVTLTQRMLGYIDAGTSVDVVTEAAPDEPIRAAITRISPFLHPVTRTTEAEIEIAEHGGRLRPGMFVTVDVLYGETELAALVPNSAIYRHPRDGREGVYAAALTAAGRDPEAPDAAALPPLRPGLEPAGPVAVRFVPVEVIARGRLASAIEGIAPGDWVVTLGHRLLSGSDSGQALIQPTPWNHIMSLQQMQTRDLLDIIRARRDELAGEAESFN